MRARPFLLASLLLLAPSPAALAGEDGVPGPKPAEEVSEDKAKEAIERFRREFETEDLDLRLESLERLARVGHASVANLLLDLAMKHPENLVRATAFKGLGRQVGSAKILGPKLAWYLAGEAKANAKAKARGNYGVLVDPKTGDADTESPEGKAKLREKRERGRMLAEAVKLLDVLGYRQRDSVEALQEFLSDGNDDLVAQVLGLFGKWKEWSVLPDLLDLYEIYPKEDEFQTGSASVDTGAAGNEDAQAAKRKWMAKFGDPDRRRPRPKVVKALKKALTDITGETFEEPKALREFLKRPDVKRKVR
jgi:hypothetical protein